MQLTEAELIQAAQRCLNGAYWEFGRYCSQWCERYARGRTYRDFAELVGCSEDLVSSSARVFDRFAEIRDLFPNLSQTHFVRVLPLEQPKAISELRWADEANASIKQFNARLRDLRRASPGEFADGGESDDEAESDQTEQASEVSVSKRTFADEDAEHDPREVESVPYASAALTGTRDDVAAPDRDVTLTKKMLQQLNDTLKHVDDAEAFVSEIEGWAAQQRQRWSPTRRKAGA